MRRGEVRGGRGGMYSRTHSTYRIKNSTHITCTLCTHLLTMHMLCQVRNHRHAAGINQSCKRVKFIATTVVRKQRNRNDLVKVSFATGSFDVKQKINRIRRRRLVRSILAFFVSFFSLYAFAINTYINNN